MVEFSKFKEKFIEYENDPNSRLSFFSTFDVNTSTTLEDILSEESEYKEYFNILLFVAMDPWSRIRNAAIQLVYTALLRMEQKLVDKDPSSSPQSCSSPAAEGLGPLEVQKGLNGNVYRNHSRVTVSSSFFDMLLKEFQGATSWYQKDGLIRLLSKVSIFWIKEKTILNSITFRIALPSLNASELPIREGASELLVHVSLASPESVPELKKHFFETLEQLKDETGEGGIHTVEGNLIALSKVFDASLAHSNSIEIQYSAKELSTLIQLASHTAASIRSYVAETFRPPSEDFFVLAWKEILELTRCFSLEEKWTLYETMMMIMNQHLSYYLDHPCISFNRCVAHLRFPGIVSMNQVGVSLLVVLLRGINSSLFEVKRISTQVLPNWLQFYVRHVGSIYGVFELYHSLSNRTLFSSADASKSEESLASCKIVQQEFDQHALPLLWWYLVLYLMIRRHPLRDFERRILQLNTKKHLYAPLLQRAPSTANVVFLIMSTYFPHLCSVSILEQMMRKECWRAILEPYGQEYIHFGIDFVLMMRQKRINVSSLISVWASALGSLMSHQQCILLTMITEAIRFHEDEDEDKHGHSHSREDELGKKEREGVRRPFSFAYDYTYKAPAMVDGGEDTALGYTWLKSKYHTQSSLPSFFSFARSLTTEAKSIEMMQKYTLFRKEFLDESSVACIQNNVLKVLYPSSGTDALVLQKIRNLMIVLLKMERAKKGKWSNSILDAIFSRLSALSPNWKDEHLIQEQGDAENTTADDADDDWDASDDEQHCCGEGFLEEKEHATGICQAVLRFCPQSFSDEHRQNITGLMGSSQ